MSKRRKYDIKNKKSFIIIIVLSIAIIGIFSLFIYNYSKASKIEYLIEAGSILQDVDKNYITVDNDASLKIRWNGNYYLEYNGDKITLGKKVIVYNGLTTGMKLYGTFYEVASDGKIYEYKDESILDNTTTAKFYKLDDREYLLVDSKISSSDKSIETENYLLVELDKAGNAKLSNNKINLKTISPTVLLTSDYKFDIANEILNFGEYDIDLKKIIGSTNQYVPEEDSGNGTGNNEDDGNNQNVGNDIGNAGTGEVGAVINTLPGTGTVTDMEELMDKVKMTSVVRVSEGLTQIDVDYVIYDPYNEYHSVYVEVTSPGKIERIDLSKLNTHLTLDNLFANTEYKLNFVYTTIRTDAETEEAEIIPYTFASFDLRTKMPKYDISVYKISRVYNTLKYKVDLQKNFMIESVNVNVSFDYEESITIDDVTTTEKKKFSEDYSVKVTERDINAGFITGDAIINGYAINSDTLIYLTVKSVVVSGVEMPINATYTFRFGG